MPLPPFQLVQPDSLADAAKALVAANGRGRILSGGTDLLVNMKHQLYPDDTAILISVSELTELQGIHQDGDGNITIGAGERLSDIATHPLIVEHASALAHACARVAHPQARNMGTIGGNICLDVRCHYVNRTPAWREALGGCLKSEGDCCHVVPQGTRCVAALSGDTVAPLVAMGATVRLVGPDAERQISVADLRTKDGEHPLALRPGEILASVHIPAGTKNRKSSYLKWAVRKAVDFPLLSAALVLDTDSDGNIDRLQIAVGVLGPRPKQIKGLDKYQGIQLTADIARDIADRVYRQCTPLTNVLYEVDYRRTLLRVLIRRELEAWTA